MVDFKIKGSKLPVIPKGTEFRCNHWDKDSDNKSLYLSVNNCISFGYKVINNESYILAEQEGYTDTWFYMFKESDIIKLAKEQGMIEEEFKLPEKWCIKIPDYKTGLFIIENFAPKQDWYKNNPNNVNYFCFADTFFACWAEKQPKDYTEITFEQFKKYVLNLKENNNMENKEIIGYKLKEDCNQYEDAAIIISNISKEQFYSWIPKKGYNFNNGSVLYSRFKKAGVLDLWFEPVYKTKEKTLTLSNGKSIIISKDSILAEGKNINHSHLSFLTSPHILLITDWKVELKDATYKIGCWDNVKLSDINLILETYKNMQ